MKRAAILMLTLVAVSALSAESLPAELAENSVVIRAARILDVRSGRYLKDAAIYAQGQRIKAMGAVAEVLKQVPPAASVIDLKDATVVPGLIDCHTHLMARLPAGKYSYELNLLTKSQAYRALGTLEVGKFADLIAVQGDPLADVAVLQHVRFVMKGGSVVRNDLAREQ